MTTKNPNQVKAIIVTPTGRLMYPKLNPQSPALLDEDNDIKGWAGDLAIDIKQASWARYQQELAAYRSEFVAAFGEPVRFPGHKILDVKANKAGTRTNPAEIVGFAQISYRQKSENANGDAFPPPQLMNLDRTPMDHTKFYPGALCRFIVTLSGYYHKKSGYGVRSDLNGVIFVNHADKFGGSVDVSRLDAAFAVDDDEQALAAYDITAGGMTL